MAVEWCCSQPDAPLATSSHMQLPTYVHARSPIQISQATSQAYSRLTVSPSPDNISSKGSRGAAFTGSKDSQCSGSMLALRFRNACMLFHTAFLQETNQAQGTSA